MNRDHMISRLRSESRTWDIIIVGGGATGLGTAVEAASRGYRTVLLEQSDFAKGTSSRSTKLVHGGVRYLRQGNFSLVLEALRERGLLIRNAPHLVRNQSFIVPNYDWWEGPFYGVGLKLYDMLAGKLGLGPSKLLSREETLQRIPTLEPGGLRGGVVYYDGQFDDARLAVCLAQTLVDHGGVALNYMPVTSLLKANGMVCGVAAVDAENNRQYELQGKVVVNATGVFSDALRLMDDPESQSIVTASQGVHIVLDRTFQPGESAIMVPETDDGRVLFAVPWHDRVVVGTTDTPIQSISLEPRALQEEVDFLLTHAARYLTHDPTASDVLSIFAGLRPLVSAGGKKNTAALSRDHTLLISTSGLVTITGGKWTTYRKMGEDAVNEAAIVGGLEERPSVTENLKLHGWLEEKARSGPLKVYGANEQDLLELQNSDPNLREKLHPNLPYQTAEVLWAVRHEMARNVEDVLARRTRALLLDARASIQAAPRVAELMSAELGRDTNWVDQQIASYHQLAAGYLLS